MEKVALRCQENGIQLCTHAIGDSANRDVLRIYSQLIQKGNPLRWRIEHAQIVDPADFTLFKQYSIIPSVQPSHATSDHAWAPDRLGTYVTRGYQYKTLWDCNGFLPLGSDFPVESIRPVLQFYAAIARKTTDGKPQGGFQMNEALTRQQALLGLTRFAAYSMQMDDQMGSIEKGKWAHFTVFDQDIMSISVEKIPNVSTKYTIIRGNIAYSK
jgi:predicted amidohydrolase YtcJ